MAANQQGNSGNGSLTVDRSESKTSWRGRLVGLLFLVLIGGYLGYVVAIATVPDLLSHEIYPRITIGFSLALLLLALVIIVVTLYEFLSRRALIDKKS